MCIPPKYGSKRFWPILILPIPWPWLSTMRFRVQGPSNPNGLDDTLFQKTMLNNSRCKNPSKKMMPSEYWTKRLQMNGLLRFIDVNCVVETVSDYRLHQPYWSLG